MWCCYRRQRMGYHFIKTNILCQYIILNISSFSVYFSAQLKKISFPFSHYLHLFYLYVCLSIILSLSVRVLAQYTIKHGYFTFTNLIHKKVSLKQCYKGFELVYDAFLYYSVGASFIEKLSRWCVRFLIKNLSFRFFIRMLQL